MADGHRVACGALARNGNGDRTCCQRPNGCCRDRCRPAAVCQHGGRIGFAIDGHGERGPHRQPVTGAGDDQVLTVFDAVDHIVARHGIHAQARQAGVYNDFAFAHAGVAVAVGHGRRHRQITVAQGRQDGLRHAHGPGQIVLHRRGVAVAADRHGHGVARFRVRYPAANDLARGHFRRVDDVIARHGVDDDGRQRGIHQQVCGVADAVAHAVGGGRAQGVVGLTETGQIRCRNGQAPAPVRRRRGRVVFAVQGYGYHGTFRQVGAGAAHAQVLAFFHRVQHVIAAEGVEADGRQAGVDGDVMFEAAGVARAIGDGRRNGHGAVLQRGNHARRYAHAPVARRVQHGDVRLAAEGNCDLIARRRAGGGAADDLRLRVLGDVNHVVARNGVDGHRWRGEIYRQVVIHGRRVTRFVAHGCRYGYAAVG